MFNTKTRGLILGGLIALQGLPLGGVASAQPPCWPVSKCPGLLGGPRIRTSIIPVPEYLFLHLQVGGSARRVTLQVRTDPSGHLDLSNSAYKLLAGSASRKAWPPGVAGNVVIYDCERQDLPGEQTTYLCTAVR